ncbi:hypothetical protein LDENG_00236630 [Lucifuga dentata]|nr:hypothetical protein LDENG_00236630 [Lucifuga dentata]
MSSYTARGGKLLTAPSNETQKASPADSLESTSLSAIERASFLHGLQQSYGNPLHSTAVEDDLNASEEDGVKGGTRDVPEMARVTAMKQRGVANKRKERQTNDENEEEERRRSTGGRGKAG